MGARTWILAAALLIAGGTASAQGLGGEVCSGAAPIAGEGTFAFDNTSATTDGPTVPCSVAPNQQIEGDRWYAWTSSFTGTASISTCGLASLDTMIAVYDACPPSTILACNDDFCAYQTEVLFPAQQGQEYRIRVGTYPGSAHGSGQFAIAESDVTSCGGAGGADITVAELTGVLHWGTAGALNGYSFGATACNVGDATMPWEGVTNHHPVIAQNLFRVRGGRIEQVGMSWLKHGFGSATDNVCCPCQDPGNSQIIGIGCSDTYSAGINGSQGGSGGTGGLGPRSDLDAWAGFFPFPYSTQGQTGDAAYKRLQVHNDDLDPALNAGATYVGEVQYVTPDEPPAKRNNNTCHRAVLVQGPGGGGWVLQLTGTNVRELPAIYAWQAQVPAVRIAAVDVPSDGQVFVASLAADNGDGTWHYEYAVQNVNCHRSLASFKVPLPTDALVSGVGFADADYHSGELYDGTDWPASVGAIGLGDYGVLWSTTPFAVDPLANALRFGTLYNFSFDADRPPVLGDVSLGLFRPGTPGSVGAPAVVPLTVGASFCDGADGAHAACPCANPGNPDSGCDIQQATGGVHLAVAGQQTAPANRATLTGTGFPPASAPAAVVLRAAQLDPLSPVVFGDGVRCVGLPLVRLGAALAGNGASAHVFGHGSAAGGGVFYYQIWFRNTPIAFCDPAAAFNLSNGRTLAW